MNNLTQIVNSAVTNSSRSGAGLAALLIGIIGAICIGIYVMPQCVKTLKSKDTAGISLGMFVLSACGAFLFTLSALINACDKQPIETWLPMMLGNAFSCTASIIVLFLKIRNIRWAKKWGITEAQVPSHFREIKADIAKQKAAKKAEKLHDKQSEIDAKKSTPVEDIK